MVDSLRCWSPDGRGENTPTSCSFGSWNVERSGELWKNHMLVRYEDLKQDQEGMLRKIANFTGFALTEDQIQVLKIDGQMFNMRILQISEAERAYEVWQLPEVQFVEQKQKLVSKSGNYSETLLKAQAWRQGSVHTEGDCWRLDEPLHPGAKQGHRSLFISEIFFHERQIGINPKESFPGVQLLDQREPGQDRSQWWDCQIVFHTWSRVLKSWRELKKKETLLVSSC